GIAKMIAEDKIVEPLRGVRILSLNLVSLISAANSVGRAENLIEGIIEEAKIGGNIIIFIDELHTITGGGDSNEAQTIANILKPALARGDIHVIGATTLSEYRKYIEKDPALSRRFEPVRADEPDIETSIKILTNVAKKLEEFHKVTISPEAIEVAVKLSKRYVQDRFLPDKAIDLLDEASSKIVLQGRNKLEAEDIRMILADKTGIPVGSLNTDDQVRLAALETYLSTYVIGQEHAVHVVSEAIRRARAGLKDPNKPTGSFLFLGPSGVGKTELAKVLAREIYHTEKALIRLDMSEFSEQHTVQRLVGAPPGYVGYDEGGQLTNPVWEQPYSLILLDEIEKAHPKVFDIFLQVLDDGRLTDGQGRTVDFKNTIIIATSNIASDEILQVIQDNDKSKLSDPDFIQDTIIPILRDYFRPEFINRFDEVVVFNPLGKDELIQIARLQIKKIEARLAEQDIKLVVKEETLQSYANETYNPQFGARPLKRLIQDKVENTVARMIIEGRIKSGGTLEI
ncbi:ATP-dependent Clp protease ATP-binding subunit, partial [Candidatus Dojkabacteria bacterium]|nr:ATP-dependent Clp protease ATP-binding subunit [Candidatus Dojkabacteria bacterium]